MVLSRLFFLRLFGICFSVPSTTQTWNDTFLKRTGLPDELMVPSCRGLSSPISAIASAKFSKNPTEGRNCFGYDLQQKGTQFTDEVSMIKTGAGETGSALFKGDVATKTGATSWIGGWRYLLQPSMCYRFLGCSHADSIVIA